MKKIDTLVQDIYSVVDKGVDIASKDVEAFASHLSSIVKERLNERRAGSYLRLSNLGSACSRKLWFSVNHPGLAEPLAPDAKLKFLLGDVWEAVLLFLARVSGHRVEGAQDAVELHGVKGHRDAVIDGMTVDVKSASSRSFDKFAKGLKIPEDDFGYLTQLDSYVETGKDDPLVTDKERGAFLVGDKTLGKITLDIHGRADIDYEKLVQEKREMLAEGNPPPRGYQDVPEGKSGNRKLGVACSYCEFKHACWPNLRTFKYSGKPVFMTKVIREPRVEEMGQDMPF